MEQRPLTQRERLDVVNAVQTLVGRLDRVVGADAILTAYRLVAERVREEFAARYVPPPPAPPPVPLPSYRRLPPPPPTFEARAAPARESEPFDPFA